MRRFYAAPEQFQENEVHLGLEESRHLRNVLRLREGDDVSVFDGEGREFACRVNKAGREKNHSVLEIVKETSAPAPESPLDLTLAIALMKGEKFDLVIQKATELGVMKIVPLSTKRADVKIKSAEESNKKRDRWIRIAMEAAKQCGRAKIPTVTAPVEFPEYIKAADGTGLFFSERDGTSLADLALTKPETNKITAIVGPEGGWEDSEIELARENGFFVITLGGRILRAETAGIAVTALLQNAFGDLN